jgi:hypothetical protein
MAIDAVSICNKALIFLGQETIGALTDNNKRAEVCRDVYNEALAEFISEGEWSFCKAMATLTADDTPPNHHYSYAFDLPDDCLRLVRDKKYAVSNCDDWMVVGNQIYCNAEEIDILYLTDYSYVSMWPAKARAALAYLVAHYIGMALCGDEGRVQMAYELYMKTLTDALSDDGAGAAIQPYEYAAYVEERS